MKLVNCPVCGKRLSADIENCPECGFTISAYMSNQSGEILAEKSTTAYSRKSDSKWPIRTILLPIIVAIFVLGIIQNFSSKQEPLSTNSTEQQSSLSYNIDKQQGQPSICGVYHGDDSDILVISEDHLAYYYCTTNMFTELQCPWTYSDGVLEIEMAKLHCTLTATNVSMDTNSLLLCSDSVSWDSEYFVKTNSIPEDYITRRVESSDPAVEVQTDGTLTFTLDKIHFEIPKRFIDWEDPFDLDPKIQVFIEEDPHRDYVSTLFFHHLSFDDIGYTPDPSGDFPGYITYPGSYLTDCSFSSTYEDEVAGFPAIILEVTGYLNSGFGGITGYSMSGILCQVFNYDTNSVLYIYMLQSYNSYYDNSEFFMSLLKNATSS